MALKMRATGLSSPVDEHLTDFTVLTGEWVIGRIYEIRGSPPDLRWFWSLHLNGPMKRSDRIASLEEAKDQFKTSWEAWKVWANLEERDLGGTLMSPTKLCERVLLMAITPWLRDAGVTVVDQALKSIRRTLP
jgi:hypothetical protein